MPGGTAMANILDYLDWRGDLQISERGFNEVDNLLLAELCYLDFGGIVPPGFDAPVPLQVESILLKKMLL